eukprot:TRINITY_DN15275_c0_g1_i1.p1 TRINITY_DN15275_c0_g1~~TRINITY_DN15275_c0_g1_i1.p1  ORF type:complete len:361 (+),score=33.67 TRINITY_DN15275_c0_g1_i1:146-1228(+)
MRVSRRVVGGHVRPVYTRTGSKHKPMKTLSDLLPVNDDEPSSLMKHSKGEIVTGSSLAFDTDFETFIVAKADGEAYFRTNPPWIGVYVISRFRKLLIKLKDDSHCIDYTLLQVKQSTDDQRYLKLSTEAEQKNALFRKPGTPSGIITRYKTYDIMGGGTHLQPEFYDKKKNFMQKVNQHRKDRRLIHKTLANFPFPDLKCHSAGSISFAEILNYFKHEMKCTAIRTWTENYEQFCELSIPPLEEVFVFNDFNDRNVSKKRVSLRTVVPQHWLGEDLRPYDVAFGHIRTGGTWKGHLRSFGYLGRQGSETFDKDFKKLSEKRRTPVVDLRRKFWWNQSRRDRKSMFSEALDTFDIQSTFKC